LILRSEETDFRIGFLGIGETPRITRKEYGLAIMVFRRLATVLIEEGLQYTMITCR